MMRALVPLAAVLMSLGGCASDSSTVSDSPVGSYRVTGTADAVTPPAATLEIAGASRYRFCQGDRCVEGRWTLQRLAPGDGRITFAGREFEAYVLALSAAAHGRSEIDRQRGVQGAIDLDFRADRSGATIPLHVGDIAFVRP